VHTSSFPARKRNWHCGLLCRIVPQTVMCASWQVPVEDTSFLKVMMRDLPLLIWCQEIDNFLWEVLPHPPFSTCFAPSDLHLLKPLIDHVQGGHFENDGAIQQTSDRTSAVTQGDTWFRTC
jgi:hypothetical protein